MTTTDDFFSMPDARDESMSVGRAHEHGWLVDSRHRTSQGWVLYVRCAACGARRVDLRADAAVVPEPCSVVVHVDIYWSASS